MNRTALLMIEAQNEWYADGGILHGLVDAASLSAGLNAQRQLLHAARAARLPVLHAQMDFRRGYSELGDAAFGLRRAIQQHQVWTGGGVAAAAGLEPVEGEFVFRRTGASGFTGSPLDSILRNQRIDRVIVAGVATQVCVLATVCQAHDLGYTVIVPPESTVAFPKTMHGVMFQDILPHFAGSPSLESVLDDLRAQAALLETVLHFLGCLQQGQVQAMMPLLSPDLVVEGQLEGAWCRWDRATYLGRVSLLHAALSEAVASVQAVHRVGDAAEVTVTLSAAIGTFYDRLSWFRQAGKWTLQHKSFLFKSLPQITAPSLKQTVSSA